MFVWLTVLWLWLWGCVVGMLCVAAVQSACFWLLVFGASMVAANLCFAFCLGTVLLCCYLSLRFVVVAAQRTSRQVVGNVVWVSQALARPHPTPCVCAGTINCLCYHLVELCLTDRLIAGCTGTANAEVHGAAGGSHSVHVVH